MHDYEGTDEKTGKPLINTDYNSTKRGVDTVDQMCASYSIARQIRKWPLRIFFSFLDLAGINFQVVFFHNNYGFTKRLREFLCDLNFAILGTHLKISAEINSLPKDIKIFLVK